MFELLQELKRTWHYLFHRGGHGIHSQFAFDLIRDVVEEKHPYYCFPSLKSKNRYRKQSPKQTGCICKTKHLELLFRLCIFLDSQEILILGRADSAVEDYIRASGANREIKRIDDKALGMQRKGLFKSKADQLITVESPQQLAELEIVLNDLLPKDSLAIVLQKSWKCKNEIKHWKQIKQSSPPVLSLDLVELELLFYHPKLNKKQYKAFI